MPYNDKKFMTYNKQMRFLRDEKNISCNGTTHKSLLAKSGYFNLINGYKKPFIVSSTNGINIYRQGTTLDEIYYVKLFDSDLRHLLLKYITRIEEEIRTFTAYKFDEINDHGKIHWYQIEAYNTSSGKDIEIMQLISNTYKQVSLSKAKYVQFYIKEHNFIPTWIMIKVIKFSNLINIIEFGKRDIYQSLCNLYDISLNGHPSKKLLLGSLHWLREIRNYCAHNERIFDICRPNSRIIDSYFTQLPSTYRRCKDRNIMDAIICFKYFLHPDDFNAFVQELAILLNSLQGKINLSAFNYIRGQMGIRNLNHLHLLNSLPKNAIHYNKF